MTEEIHRLEFTKFSLINAAISLIPIFPTWTLFPGVILGSVVGDAMGKCEFGYETILWVCVAITIAMVSWYFSRVQTIITSKNRHDLKIHFRIFCLIVYTLLNTAFLIK